MTIRISAAILISLLILITVEFFQHTTNFDHRASRILALGLGEASANQFTVQFVSKPEVDDDINTKLLPKHVQNFRDINIDDLKSNLTHIQGLSKDKIASGSLRVVNERTQFGGSDILEDCELSRILSAYVSSSKTSTELNRRINILLFVDSVYFCVGKSIASFGLTNLKTHERNQLTRNSNYVDISTLEVVLERVLKLT